MGWDGMGWDGMGWDGMGWDGMGRGIPNRFRMLNGSLLYRSTPAEVTRTKRLTLFGVAFIRLPVAIESVCSGPFPPFHLLHAEQKFSDVQKDATPCYFLLASRTQQWQLCTKCNKRSQMADQAETS